MVEDVRLRLRCCTAVADRDDAVNLVRANTEGDAADAVPVALSVFDCVCGFGLVVLVSPTTNKRGRFFVVMLRGRRFFGFLVTPDFLLVLFGAFDRIPRGRVLLVLASSSWREAAAASSSDSLLLLLLLKRHQFFEDDTAPSLSSLIRWCVWFCVCIVSVFS